MTTDATSFARPPSRPATTSSWMTRDTSSRTDGCPTETRTTKDSLLLAASPAGLALPGMLASVPRQPERPERKVAAVTLLQREGEPEPGDAVEQVRTGGTRSHIDGP